MSKINEQIQTLRDVAGAYKHNGLSLVLREAADTIESLSAKLDAANGERTDGVWIPCDEDKIPGNEVLCCDDHGEMILGDVFLDETSETGFSAENDHVYMHNCVKWMEKPKP